MFRQDMFGQGKFRPGMIRHGMFKQGTIRQGMFRQYMFRQGVVMTAKLHFLPLKNYNICHKSFISEKGVFSLSLNEWNYV